MDTKYIQRQLAVNLTFTRLYIELRAAAHGDEQAQTNANSALNRLYDERRALLKQLAK